MLDAMQLRPEQIKKFKDLHKKHELDGYTEEEIREIATGVVNIYLTLYGIYQRIGRQKKEQDDK
jgi:hypothetical protein